MPAPRADDREPAEHPETDSADTDETNGTGETEQARAPDRTEAAARERHPTALVFAFDVDDRTYRHREPRITGAEIRDRAGIPHDQPLVRVLDGGNVLPVGPDDVVYLVRGLYFRRRPRFRRS